LREWSDPDPRDLLVLQHNKRVSSVRCGSEDTLRLFGKVLQGKGNGVAGVDGAIDKNVFGTYLHGPVLARNPEFADLLLERAVGSTLSSVNDELATRYAMWRRELIK